MNFVFLELTLKQCKLLIRNIFDWHLTFNRIAVCQISMHQDLFLKSKMLLSFVTVAGYTGHQHFVSYTVGDTGYCYQTKAADVFRKLFTTSGRSLNQIAISGIAQQQYFYRGNRAVHEAIMTQTTIFGESATMIFGLQGHDCKQLEFCVST